MIIPFKADTGIKRFPVLTLLLIAANVALYLYSTKPVAIEYDFAETFAAVPAEITQSPFETIRYYGAPLALSLPRLLMEMLVFSRPGHIELLPAWPEGYPDGSVTGVLVRGGHRLDMVWSRGEVVSATFHAGRDDRGSLVCGSAKKPFEFEAGRSYRFDGRLRER